MEKIQYVVFFLSLFTVELNVSIGACEQPFQAGNRLFPIGLLIGSPAPIIITLSPVLRTSRNTYIHAYAKIIVAGALCFLYIIIFLIA